MKKYYADLHVHIGRSSKGRIIKMATAANLTFENIAHEALCRKGIEIIGVADCISPHVLRDIDDLAERGLLADKKGGGMVYKGEQTMLLGTELETHEQKDRNLSGLKPPKTRKGSRPRCIEEQLDPTGSSAHSLCFMPTLEQMKLFSKEMSRHINNINASSTVCRLTAQELFDIVYGMGGIMIPAHVFTPHKGFYGCVCRSLREVFDEASFERIPAVELGLSSDTTMAGALSELGCKTFLSDSDAHSLPKIGREYNVFELEEPSFEEVLKALLNTDGRRVAANYGLNPLLGKYHRSYCLVCEKVIEGEPPVLKCPASDRHPVITGVRDRLEQIADRRAQVKDCIEAVNTYGIKDMQGINCSKRPPYHYQVPLEFIPGVGGRTMDRLIERFGTEMKVLHEASREELMEVVKPEVAQNIILAREGKLGIGAGGGGVYGKIET